MKRSTTLILISLAIAGWQGCKSSNNSENTEEGQTETAEDSASGYSVQEAYTNVEWTAYKTTARVPVKGSFKEFHISAPENAESITSVLTGLTFEIITSSSFSNEASRDAKIAQFFYGTLASSDKITGKIESVNGTDTGGVAMVAITLNDSTNIIEAPYSIKDNQVMLNAHIELEKWNAVKGIDALNKVCEMLHTGADGKSKLWSDVDVTVTSTLKGNSPAS
ncbi:MAG: hypothetical protein GC181_04365 [Bacteroidetes bacterium]|nr:hypothetical protein [Bacteroidota bacterium]